MSNIRWDKLLLSNKNALRRAFFVLAHVRNNKFIELLANPYNFWVQKIVSCIFRGTLQLLAQVINHFTRNLHAADPHPHYISHYFTINKGWWKG